MKRTRDFAQVVRKRLAADPDLAAAVEKEAFSADIAEQIYRARTNARLTQKQLADRIGTHQSVIARLEDADYDGHSLSMLRRIGDALNCQVRVEFYRRAETTTVKYDPGIAFEPGIVVERGITFESKFRVKPAETSKMKVTTETEFREFQAVAS